MKIKKIKYAIFLLFSLTILSCNSVGISEQDFDRMRWKNDKNGCQGEREKMLADFENIKPQLYQLLEMRIIELLGKPDYSNLGIHNQKKYIYFIEPRNGYCSDRKPVAKPKVLQIYFDALNQAKEILIVEDVSKK